MASICGCPLSNSNDWRALINTVLQPRGISSFSFLSILLAVPLRSSSSSLSSTTQQYHSNSALYWASRRRMAIFVAASLLFRLVKATLCYDASGNSMLNRAASPASWSNVTEDMCTSGAVTWCCSNADYCLSNGLCIGGGSDNRLLQ